MAARVQLRKLLKPGAPNTGAFLDLSTALGVAVEVQDAGGRRLLGDAPPDAPVRLPVEVEGEVVGWVVGDDRVRPLASLLTVWVAEEAQRKALAAEALSAWREITLLYKLSEELAGSLRSQRLITVALTEASRAIKGTWGVVLLADPDSAEQSIAASFGEEQTPGAEAVIDVLWRSLRRVGKAEIVNDLRADPRFEEVTGTPLSALLWAPLATPQGLRGALAIGRAGHARDYVAGDLSLLTSIASQAAPAVENAILYENLERLVEERTHELSLAKEEAEEASRAKTRFLANMSHELRTPLNALLGYAQILRRGGDLTDKQRHGVEVIQRSGEHLLTLINDLLDLSKIEAGRLEREDEELSLHELVGSLAEIFQLRAEEQGIGFTSTIDEAVPDAVRGDPRKLRQVLLNLLSNALKYTDAGAVELRVEPDTLGTRFTVRDTGIGIAPADQREIFEAFRQVARKGRTTEGTGLGLAISQRLVEVMGGELSLQSEPGRGSTFWFTVDLPAVDAARAEIAHDVVGYDGGPFRILVVEDDPQNRAIVAMLLRPLGFEVHEAVDGRAGVAAVKTLRPDAVLMDLVMPEMDGYAAIAAIRADPELRDTVIVVLSASVFPADRAQSVKAGGDDFVPKPIHAPELLDALARHLPLTWRRRDDGTPAPAPPSDSGEAVLPPSEALRALAEAASLGRIAAVREVLDGLDARYAPFADPLRELASRFQLDAIHDSLRAYLDDEDGGA